MKAAWNRRLIAILLIFSQLSLAESAVDQRGDDIWKTLSTSSQSEVLKLYRAAFPLNKKAPLANIYTKLWIDHLREQVGYYIQRNPSESPNREAIELAFATRVQEERELQRDEEKQEALIESSQKELKTLELVKADISELLEPVIEAWNKLQQNPKTQELLDLQKIIASSLMQLPYFTKKTSLGDRAELLWLALLEEKSGSVDAFKSLMGIAFLDSDFSKKHPYIAQQVDLHEAFQRLMPHLSVEALVNIRQRTYLELPAPLYAIEHLIRNHQHNDRFSANICYRIYRNSQDPRSKNLAKQIINSGIPAISLSDGLDLVNPIEIFDDIDNKRREFLAQSFAKLENSEIYSGLKLFFPNHPQQKISEIQKWIFEEYFKDPQLRTAKMIEQLTHEYFTDSKEKFYLDLYSRIQLETPEAQLKHIPYLAHIASTTKSPSNALRRNIFKELRKKYPDFVRDVLTIHELPSDRYTQALELLSGEEFYKGLTQESNYDNLRFDSRVQEALRYSKKNRDSFFDLVESPDSRRRLWALGVLSTNGIWHTLSEKELRNYHRALQAAVSKGFPPDQLVLAQSYLDRLYSNYKIRIKNKGTIPLTAALYSASRVFVKCKNKLKSFIFDGRVKASVGGALLGVSIFKLYLQKIKEDLKEPEIPKE